jgi:hypothetical protein
MGVPPSTLAVGDPIFTKKYVTSWNGVVGESSPKAIGRVQWAWVVLGILFLIIGLLDLRNYLSGLFVYVAAEDASTAVEGGGALAIVIADFAVAAIILAFATSPGVRSLFSKRSA